MPSRAALPLLFEALLALEVVAAAAEAALKGRAAGLVGDFANRARPF